MVPLTHLLSEKSSSFQLKPTTYQIIFICWNKPQKRVLSKNKSVPSGLPAVSNTPTAPQSDPSEGISISSQCLRKTASGESCGTAQHRKWQQCQSTSSQPHRLLCNCPDWVKLPNSLRHYLLANWEMFLISRPAAKFGTKRFFPYLLRSFLR